jgi:hypothetical protein
MLSLALIVFVPLLFWLAVVYRLPAFCRRYHDPGVRAFWFTLVNVALATTILVPPIYLAIDTVIGVPNSARLLSNLVMALGAYTALRFVAHLVGRSRSDRTAWLQRLGLVGTLIALVISFAHVPVTDSVAVDFIGRHGDAPWYLAYRLVFLGWMAFALRDLAHSSHYYAQVSAKPASRFGMLVLYRGTAFGLLYLLHEALYAIARHFHRPYLPQAELITDVLKAIALTMIVTGATMPSWGPRIGVPKLLTTWDRYRTHLLLRPLWQDLRVLNPGVVLIAPPSRWREVVQRRDFGFRAIRRMVEIRDWLLILRHYRPAILPPGPGIDPAVWPFAVAFERWRQEARPVALATPASPAEQLTSEDEVAELRRLARQWRRARALARKQLARQAGHDWLPATPDD